MDRLIALKRWLPRLEMLPLGGALVAFAFVARSFTEAHIHGANVDEPCGLLCWLAFSGLAATTVIIFTTVSRALR